MFRNERIEPRGPVDSEVDYIFIAEFQCSYRTVKSPLFLFGARYEWSRYRSPVAEQFVDGYFIVFVVLFEANNGDWCVARLAQDKGIVFQEEDCAVQEFLPASDVLKSVPKTYTRPEWVVSEAYWPMHDGRTMEFLGQVTLRESPITRQLLTWNTNVYLFGVNRPNGPTFKIMTQQSDLQSLEDYERRIGLR